MAGATATAAVGKTRSPRRRRTGGLSAWAYAAPALLVYIAFLIYPALDSVGLSFTDWNGIKPSYNWVGLDNYKKLADDPVIGTAIRNNLLWTVVTIIAPMLIGLALALALNSQMLRGRAFLRTIFYAPAVIPLVSVATIWGWLYNPSQGAVNAGLDAVGLHSLTHSWLGDDSTALWAAMVPAIWVRAGFPMLLYLAALQGIPKELYESARVDGAGAWQRFRFVTLPALRPTNYIVLALSLIESFKVFDLIYALTYGGPGRSTQVLGTWMYFNVFQYYRAGYGAAIAVVITLVAVFVGIPYVLSQTKD
ncbi:carbohydrate ABC transporter permease [Streptomyces arenae]|uniref:carbohydrate ABC transporter permease n=1 Tax=Streptomyces arenae TaxID=29301 RepID=UPI00265AA31A|nr:sugar ABC transporter permease [Streptomyces arenae]MCG7209618.1 sugar ABC transporter permease [Streptomyces arenae]